MPIIMQKPRYPRLQPTTRHPLSITLGSALVMGSGAGPQTASSVGSLVQRIPVREPVGIAIDVAVDAAVGAAADVPAAAGVPVGPASGGLGAAATQAMETIPIRRMPVLRPASQARLRSAYPSWRSLSLEATGWLRL
jgi:hypothetical protein